jgi:Raf kinase inhibitor-like YbhB/YbcL family protein
MSLTLTSTAFQHDGEIPPKYTCEGDDVSPALSWVEVPAGAASLALVMDDPDAPDPKAPKMTWVHWVLYNIPASATGLEEGISPQNLPSGTLEGLNDWKRTGWGGPCPPQGRHRYSFRLYALDVVLPDLHKPTKSKVESSMEGHILAQAELIGAYEKVKKTLLGSLLGR